MRLQRLRSRTCTSNMSHMCGLEDFFHSDQQSGYHRLSDSSNQSAGAQASAAYMEPPQPPKPDGPFSRGTRATQSMRFGSQASAAYMEPPQPPKPEGPFSRGTRATQSIRHAPRQTYPCRDVESYRGVAYSGKQHDLFPHGLRKTQSMRRPHPETDPNRAIDSHRRFTFSENKPRGVPIAFMANPDTIYPKKDESQPRGIPIAFRKKPEAMPPKSEYSRAEPMKATVPGIPKYADEMRILVDQMDAALEGVEDMRSERKMRSTLERVLQSTHRLQRIKQKICPDSCNSFFNTVNMISRACLKELSQSESSLDEMMPGAVAIKGFVYSLIVEIDADWMTFDPELSDVLCVTQQF